jgi:hypothetical protein
MKKRPNWQGAVLATAVAMITLVGPASGQQAEPTGDRQKPVINTYDKRPDPSGDNQKLDAVRYQESNRDNDVSNSERQKPVINTYDKRPDPSGDNQKLDAERYHEDHPDNDGHGVTPEGEDKRGDSQKESLSTYHGRPGAQGQPSQNDVSNLEAPRSGDSQKPVVPTYDKRPDPKGNNQKLDAVRYQENNEANDGRELELQMRVLEGSVVE